jgi:hypothetical protein
MKRYVYKPIIYIGSVRVLILEPGGKNYPLQCCLQEKRLSDEPQYEAISYVWGDEMPRFDIVVDGEMWDI